jgi:putative transcriptional regulator
MRAGLCYSQNVKGTLHFERRYTVKNRIEAIRKDRGIRQDEFAKALGVSRQTISSLETGRYNPSIMLAWKIARYFGMTIEEVFIFEEEDGGKV